jgi:hypothetical protein
VSINPLSLRGINDNPASFPQALDDMLNNLQLLDRQGDEGGVLESPSQGVAIIEAGMTAGAKGWASAVAALGTAGFIGINIIAGEKSLTSMLLLGLAVMVASSVLAIALIVCFDVRARGMGAAAMYAARAAVAVEALRLAERQLPSAPSVEMLDVEEVIKRV